MHPSGTAIGAGGRWRRCIRWTQIDLPDFQAASLFFGPDML